MTLGIGVSCPEGAVLVTDSMLWWSHGQQTQSWGLVERKFGELPRWNGAFVSYGVGLVEDRLSPFWFRRDTLRDTIADIQRDVQSFAALVPNAENELAQTLAAGTESGRVQMIFWNGEQEFVGPESGAIFLLGLAHRWRDRVSLPALVPSSLSACHSLAIALAARFMDQYLSGLSVDHVPHVAYPLQLAQLTPNHLLEFSSWPSSVAT